MKTNFLKRAATLLLSAGLILTTACSDDVPGGENGGKNPEGEVGYVAFSLINSSQRGGTKADGDAPTGNTDYGTAEENKVNTALILLYDETGTDLKYKFSLTTAEIGTPGAPGSGMADITPDPNATTYKTKAKAVVLADYKLAVFINPPKAITDIAEAEGSKWSAMAAAATLSGVTALTGSDYKNFLMSNFAGLADVDKDKNIKATAEEAELSTNVVKLHVERAVAKVTLTQANQMANMSNATIGEIKWAADIVNKKTFWMRNAAKMINPIAGEFPLKDQKDVIAESTTGDGAYNYALPQYRYLMYATDPNMDGVSLRGKTGTVADGNFFYASSTTLATGTSTYVTENTMEAAEQYEDVTTSVLISAVITPAATFFGETLNGKTVDNPSDPYFLYNNMAFTLTDINDILAVYVEGVDGAYTINNDAVITNAKKNDSSITWGDLMTVEGNETLIGSLPTILANISKGTGDAVNKDFFKELVDAKASKDMASGSAVVRYFAPDAPNYYYVPIRHFGDDLQNVVNTYGRYGVVRNNWYKLTLNGIKKYGTATIPTVRKDPDDKESSWLSVQFEILPWMERNQIIGL